MLLLAYRKVGDKLCSYPLAGNHEILHHALDRVPLASYL